MPPSKAILSSGLVLLLLSACRPKDEAPDPGILRWEVVPSPAGADVLTRATFEYDYATARGIHADSHAVCSGGEILGVGKNCTTAQPAIEAATSGASLELHVEGAWREGTMAVASGKYVTPEGASLSVRSGTIDVSAAAASATVKDGSGAPFLAFLCARGSAELTSGGAVVGTLRFAIAHANRHDRDVDVPACSADL